MKIPLNILSRRTAATSFLIAFLTLLATPAVSQTSEPIITFDQQHPLVQNFDNVPMVQLFADGTVKVNRRVGMRNPGQYEIKLSADELTELMTLAQDAGIVNFDETAINKAAETSDNFTYVSDPTTTILHISRSTDGATLSSDVGPATTQTIEVTDVISNADANPDSQVMQTMKKLHIKMIELFSQAGA